jgi:hypothetical protein
MSQGVPPAGGERPEVKAVREPPGVADDQVMILTVGGDAASKGAQEVMQALAGNQRTWGTAVQRGGGPQGAPLRPERHHDVRSLMHDPLSPRACGV